MIFTRRRIRDFFRKSWWIHVVKWATIHGEIIYGNHGPFRTKEEAEDYLTILDVMSI